MTKEEHDSWIPDQVGNDRSKFRMIEESSGVTKNGYDSWLPDRVRNDRIDAEAQSQVNSFSNNYMVSENNKILVHTCCTACASHVFSELTKAGFTPIAWFHNPQIDSLEEYAKRLGDLEKYCDENDIKLIIPEYETAEFTGLIAPYKDKESLKYISDHDRYQRRRCQLCNSLLIQRMIEQAKKMKAGFFTTTMLCSPYKNHDEIIEVANEKALDYNLNFYYQDFRKGFWMGRNYARNHAVYVSSICGCAESKKERRLE